MEIIEKYDKLNLGCGNDIKKGYLNLDFEKFKGVDLFYDLNKLPYPFKDNQFSEVIMQNILEHLNDPYQIMREIYRICKNNSIVLIRTPHFSSNNAWGDLQHKRGFNTVTFTNSNVSTMFKVEKQELTFPHIRFFVKYLAKINPIFYEKNLAYIFPAIDLVVRLRVIKK